MGPADPWRPYVFRAGQRQSRRTPVPSLQHHPVPADSLDWLLDPLPEAGPAQTGAAEELLQVLSDRGAWLHVGLDFPGPAACPRTWRRPLVGAGGQRAGYIGQRGPTSRARQRYAGPCQAGPEAP